MVWKQLTDSNQMLWNWCLGCLITGNGDFLSVNRYFNAKVNARWNRVTHRFYFHHSSIKFVITFIMPYIILKMIKHIFSIKFSQAAYKHWFLRNAELRNHCFFSIFFSSFLKFFFQKQTEMYINENMIKQNILCYKWMRDEHI